MTAWREVEQDPSNKRLARVTAVDPERQVVAMADADGGGGSATTRFSTARQPRRRPRRSRRGRARLRCRRPALGAAPARAPGQPGQAGRRRVCGDRRRRVDRHRERHRVRRSPAWPVSGAGRLRRAGRPALRRARSHLRQACDRLAVSLANGGAVGYDYLIYAVGSGSAVPSMSGAEYAHHVARMFVTGIGKVDSILTADPTVVNGNPSLLLRLDGQLDGILAVRVEDTHITGLYNVRNPEKLTRVESATLLTLR